MASENKEFIERAGQLLSQLGEEKRKDLAPKEKAFLEDKPVSEEDKKSFYEHAKRVKLLLEMENFRRKKDSQG